MSSEARPIDPARFASALEGLELPSLYEKSSEIRNQRSHLTSSNEQLLPFARDGDKDCDDAIKENLEVIARMNMRLDLLKAEIERRGMRWIDEKPSHDAAPKINGTSTPGEAGDPAAPATQPSGRLNDEELARRMAERMAEEDDDNEGVHL